MFGRAMADTNKVYFDNIAAADAGDPQAQFNVATVLFHCQRLTPRDVIDNALRDGQMDTGLAEFERSRLTMCEELDSNVDQDFLPLAGKYLRAAAEQGYPPAIARDMVFRPHVYSLDQARSAVLSLFQTDTVEAYTAGFYFVANYRDDDQIGYLAWETLSCEKNPGCDMAALEAERLFEYQSTTLDLVDSRVADIMDRIEAGDWVGLL